MEVRVLPPQLDIKVLEELAKIRFEDDLKREIESIIKWASVLENVPDVEPLFSPFESSTHLREDRVWNWEFDDPRKNFPESFEGFLRFVSPIGRKT